MRSHAKAMFVVAALCSFFAFAGPASAFEFERLGVFAEGPPSDHVPTHHKHIAVEPSTGSIFVANTQLDRIDVYRPTSASAELLTSFGEGTLEEPYGLAIDEDAGKTYVYVSDSGHDRIRKYESDGASTPSFVEIGAPDFVSPAQGTAGQGANTGQLGSFSAALTVDPASHDLLVADPGNDLVERFESDGTFLSSFDGSDGSLSPGAFTGLLDLAVDPSGDIYVVDQQGDVAYEFFATSRAERFDSAGEYKSSLAVNQPGTVAVRPNGEVIVSGDQGSWNSGHNLTLHFFDDGGVETSEWTIPGEGGFHFEGSPGKYSTVTGVAAAGGPAQFVYAATDSDRNGEYGAPSVQVYGIFTPDRPMVTTGLSDQVTDQTAGFHGTLNPNGASTAYWFEYGPTDSYGSETSHLSAGEGRELMDVSRFVNGLTGNTGYHYRLVAQNEKGTTLGADRTFTTRTAGQLESPSGARSYELVSPVVKGGIDIQPGAWEIKASTDGNRVLSFGYPLPDAPAAAAENGRLSTRGPDGWSTEDITPPYHPSTDQAIDPYFQLFSPDLSKAGLFTSDPPLAPGAQANTGNLYIRNNDETSGKSPYTVITPSGPPYATNRNYYAAISDATADFNHVVFDSPWPMTENAPPGSNVYEWVRGSGVRLASILPNGEPAQGAYSGSSNEQGNLEGIRQEGNGAGTLSADGSRLFFTTRSHHTGEGEVEFDRQIYARIDGAETIPVSASQRTDCADHDPCSGALEPDPAGGRPALFLSATPDGSRVFFRSSERLTDDADSGTQLYMFDVDTRHLTDLSVSASLPDGTGPLLGMIGASEDGSRVYYVSGAAGEPRVYLWSNGEIRYVATLGSTTTEQCNWTPIVGKKGCGGPKLSRLSSDGRYMLMSSARPLTGYPTQKFTEIYLYDSVKDELTCASCAPTRFSSSPDSASLIAEVVPGRYHGYDTTPLMDDGRVFFETAQPLLARDTNHRIDVYMYDHGQLELISTGDGNDDAYLGDVSPSGKDVFFFTRAQLVAVDVDHNSDLYDARVGGGIASQQVGPAKPSPCQGESCQPAPNPPNDPTPASMSFSGAGNVKASAKRGHHKKKHGKHRKAHRKHKKKTGAKQRAKKPSTHRNG